MEFMDRLLRARRRRRATDELMQLDGHILRDIGLEEHVLQRIAAGHEFGRLQGRRR